MRVAPASMRQLGLTVPSKSVLAPASTIAISTNCTGFFRPVVSESSTQNSPDSTRLLAHSIEPACFLSRLRRLLALICALYAETEGADSRRKTVDTKRYGAVLKNTKCAFHNPQFLTRIACISNLPPVPPVVIALPGVPGVKLALRVRLTAGKPSGRG